MRGGVGAPVQLVVIPAFVYAHAPQHYRGVIAVFAHHLAHVLNCAVLPQSVANVLPARRLGKYKYAHLVAGVYEMAALGVMAGAYGVHRKLLFEYACVLPLQGLRRGIADVRPALVAVKPAHKTAFAVKVKAVRLELGAAEAEPNALFVKLRAVFAVYRGLQGIKPWAVRRPRHDARPALLYLQAGAFKRVHLPLAVKHAAAGRGAKAARLDAAL